MAVSTRDLLVGLAEYLDAAGVGTWSPTGIFPSGAVGIVIGVVPPTPDRIVTLSTPYLTVDDAGGAFMGHGLWRVQVWLRGNQYDPMGALDLEDAVFGVLHAAGPLTLGGVRVASIQRVSVGVMGPDGDHREERTANYELALDVPTAGTF